MTKSHYIKQETMELAVPDQRMASDVQKEISYLQRVRITSMLEHICDELSVDGEIIRIEELDLDLGNLSFETIREELPSKLESAFRLALSEKILALRHTAPLQPQDGQIHPEAVSHLEHFLHYLQFGIYSADSAHPGRTFIELFDELIREVPAQLIREVQLLLPREEVLRRVVWQLDEAHLVRLIDMYAGDNARFIAAVVEDWKSAINEGLPWQLPKNQLYDLLWQVILRSTNVINLAGPRESALSEVAYQFVLRLSEIVPEERLYCSDTVKALQILEARMPVKTRFLSLVLSAIQSHIRSSRLEKPGEKQPEQVDDTRKTKLDAREEVQKEDSIAPDKDRRAEWEKETEHAPPEGDEDPAIHRAESEDAAPNTDKFSQKYTPEKEVGDSQLDMSKKVPDVEKDSARERDSTPDDLPKDVPENDRIKETAKSDREDHMTQQTSDESHTIDRLSGEGDNQSPTSPLGVKDGRQSASELPEREKPEADAEFRRIPKKDGPPHPVESKWRAPVKLPEQLYINNAGLALLWRYLPTLFPGMGWMEDNAFRSEEDQFRAVCFLQYLVTGEDGAEEAELVFNKLLCGLEPFDPVPADILLSTEEKEEAENLLSVVIEHWEVLRNTSIEGLRQTFLQKEGILRKDFQGWKLHVERSTIDILLERLPWSYSIIRLPWIKEIINVEW